MQVCTLLQTDNHASTPPLSVFTGRMPFLPPNQQRQSTEWVREQSGNGKETKRRMGGDVMGLEDEDREYRKEGKEQLNGHCEK